MSRGALLAGPFALAVVLAGCQVPWYRDNVYRAQSDFSLTHYCPRERVGASVVPASPPAKIAADADRLAMWERAHGEEGEQGVIVAGCGEEARYDCRVVPPRRDGESYSRWERGARSICEMRQEWAPR